MGAVLVFNFMLFLFTFYVLLVFLSFLILGLLTIIVDFSIIISVKLSGYSFLKTI
jgi:hypothetical protein